MMLVTAEFEPFPPPRCWVNRYCFLTMKQSWPNRFVLDEFT